MIVEIAKLVLFTGFFTVVIAIVFSEIKKMLKDVR